MNTKYQIKFAIILLFAAFTFFGIFRFADSKIYVQAQEKTASASPTLFDQKSALAKLNEQIKGKENEPAEKVFKNIQTLKGVPAGRLLRIMEMGYARSLGVDCTHCHTPEKWETEDKPTKQIARDMAAMVNMLNGETLKSIKNLNEKATINCTTCHRGQVKPALNLPTPTTSAVSTVGENKIPAGKSVNVDGKAETGEWDDAKIVNIATETDWTVKVFFKQDDQNLYFRFSNLKLAEKKEFYPEVLIDAKNSKAKTWQKSHWWFHISYSNCESEGVFNNYKSCKKGAKTGWNGNNFPLAIGGDVEMSVSKNHLSIKSGDTIGLAFDVTDTQKKWFFYPANAKLESPETWANFKL